MTPTPARAHRRTNGRPRLRLLHRVAIAVVACAHAACTLAPVAPPALPAPPPAPPPAAAAVEAPTPVAAPARSARPYGDSPITPTVEALTAAALAALRGDPLDPLPVPTRRGGGAAQPHVDVEVRDGVGAQPAGEPTVLGWFMEVTFVLKTGEPTPGAPPEASDGRLQVILYVGRGGVRVAGLRVSSVRPAPAPRAPTGLAGLEQVGRAICAHLRAGTLAELEIGDEERQVIDDEHLWREIASGTGRRDALPRAAVLASVEPQATLGIDLDDMGVIVRDELGRLFTLAYDVDEIAGQLVLEDEPLIRVRAFPR